MLNVVVVTHDLPVHLKPVALPLVAVPDRAALLTAAAVVVTHELPVFLEHVALPVSTCQTLQCC